MGFPLTPRSITLDDLELLEVNSLGISQHFVCFGGNNRWTNEDSTILSANCSPLNVLFSSVYIALISHGIPQLGGIKQLVRELTILAATHMWGGGKRDYNYRVEHIFRYKNLLVCLRCSATIRSNLTTKIVKITLDKRAKNIENNAVSSCKYARNHISVKENANINSLRQSKIWKATLLTLK